MFVLGMVQNSSEDVAGMVIMIIMISVMFLIYGSLLAANIFFNISVYKCLSKCSPENQTLEPALVFLNLVPCLSMGWFIFTVVVVRNTLTNEYRSRGMNNTDDFCFGFGLTSGILACCKIIPYIGILFYLISLPFWIIYWVKVVKYSRELDLTDGLESEEDGYWAVDEM